jgi:biopolymer transport protein ExbD
MRPNHAAPFASLFLICSVLPLAQPTPVGFPAWTGRAAKQCGGQEAPVELVVGRSGAVTFQGEPVRLDELPARVRLVMRTRATRVAVVHGGAEADYGFIVAAIAAMTGEVDRVILSTPKLDERARGCYAVGSEQFRDLSLPDPAAHVQPAPRWRIW